MKTFDVYNPWKISLISAGGSTITTSEYLNLLDFYGGHGVISIGHNNPVWVSALQKCLSRISYYSNVLEIKEQTALAEKFQKVSGMKDYSLFLCNSGAEANENAMKIASFKTQRSKFLAFKGSFHGRTAGALSVTDNLSIQPVFGNELKQNLFSLSDAEALKKALETQQYAAVIIEGIQGVAGVFEAEEQIWKTLAETCKKTGTLLIADEIQSGCGRTGNFFAFQHWNVQPDIITMAKGIGNGFPVAGVMVHPEIKPVKNQLGTTFGGSYLACAAALSVLEEIDSKQLIKNSRNRSVQLKKGISTISGIKEIRGRGLMLGIQTQHKASLVQARLLEKGIVCGTSACQYTIRLLPPLTISENEADVFLKEFTSVMKELEPVLEP